MYPSFGWIPSQLWARPQSICWDYKLRKDSEFGANCPRLSHVPGPETRRTFRMWKLRTSSWNAENVQSSHHLHQSTCSHIHSIPVQELYSCTHWTYVPYIGKPTHPTQHILLAPAHIFTISVAPNYKYIKVCRLCESHISNPLNQYLEKFGKICMKILQQFCKNKSIEELLKVLQRKVKWTFNFLLRTIMSNDTTVSAGSTR